MHDRPKKDYLLRSPGVSIHAFDAVKYFWPHELIFVHHRDSYAADRGSGWKANRAGDLGFKPKLNGPGGPAGRKAGRKPGMWVRAESREPPK
jgi:hypothetical protein